MFSLRSTTYQHLRPARVKYLETTTVPLDGMWEDAFFASATLMEICADDKVIGFCGLNADGALLGFHTYDPRLRVAAFTYCLSALGVSTAYVSTAEPSYLALCLDRQTNTEINAFMYQDTSENIQLTDFPDGMTFCKVQHSEYPLAVAFCLEAIRPDPDWLRGYYSERIEKKELYGLWKGEKMIGAGELRLSASQKNVADVGMIVAPSYRGQGLATRILKQLLYEGNHQGLRLICSTKKENVAAQKAITHAGFHSNHRILEISFVDRSKP